MCKKIVNYEMRYAINNKQLCDRLCGMPCVFMPDLNEDTQKFSSNRQPGDGVDYAKRTAIAPAHFTPGPVKRKLWGL